MSEDRRSRKRPGIAAQRQAVLSAAAALFTAHGVASVSISQICTEAGISRPTFYRCFPDKAALIAALYRLAVQEHVQLNLAAVLPEEGRPEDVRAALEVMVGRIFARPGLAAFLFAASHDAASPAQGIVEDARTEAAERIAGWYTTRGLTPPPRTTLLAVMVACQWITHDAIRRGLSPAHRAEAVEAMWALVAAVFSLPLSPAPDARPPAAPRSPP